MSDVYGPAALASGQALTSFMAFLPRLSDVRKANAASDIDIAADVRLGEVAATAVTIGIGIVASSLSGSPVPMYAAAFVAVILIAVYECALRGNNLFEPTKFVGVTRDA